MPNDERLGASFSIDIANLRAGLTQANRLIKESQSEFRAAAAGMDNWQKSEDGLNAKIKSLSSIIDLQKTKVDALTREYDALIDDGLDPASARAVNLRTQINNEQAALNKNETELKAQKKALEELGDESEETGNSLADVGTKAEKTSGGFSVMKGALANLVADGFRMATQAAKDFVTSMIDVGKSFDTAMSQVGAISGANESELETLREKAKQLGESTKFTATEAADAFNYMAMAGWTVEDMLGGIEGILNLAAASGADLATTSDIVTDALTAMGYSAKDAGRLADVMAAASSNANTNVELMGNTFQYAAPVVGALGYSMEDTAVAIGLMANAGIKGQKAGTALRAMLTNLASPSKTVQTAMDKIGLTLTDASGKMKPFSQIIVELRKAFSTLNETQQASIASGIAGKEAMSGLLAIVNAAPAEFEKLTQAVKDSDGAAQSMSTTMLDNLGGDMTVLNSKLEGIRIQLYEKIAPSLRDAVQSVQKQLNKVNWDAVGTKAAKAFRTAKDSIVAFGKQALPLAKSVGKVLGGALQFAAENFGTLAKVTMTAVVVFKTLKAAMAVTTAVVACKNAIQGLSAGVGIATKAQALWNAAMSANPIGAVITAVALLAGGIALLATNLGNVNTAEGERLKAAQDTLDKVKEEKQAYDELREAQALQTDKDLAQIENAERLAGELDALTDATGKVKDKDKERAEFILGELNDALGTEYSMTGNQIKNYKTLQDEIGKTIEAKKAEIMFEAYKPVYTEALQNYIEKQKDAADLYRQIAAAQEDVIQKEKEYQDAIDKAEEDVYENGQTRINETKDALKKAKETLETLQEAYNTNEEHLRDYYADIADYEDAAMALQQGNAKETIRILTEKNSAFRYATNVLGEEAEKQRLTLEQQVKDAEINADLMRQRYEAGVKGVTKEMVDAAYAEVATARKNFEAVGGSAAEGLIAGIRGKIKSVASAAKDMVEKALKSAKKTAEIKSPSRRFRREVGEQIPAGVGGGIASGTGSLLRTVKNQVDALRNAYNLGDVLPSIDAGLQARPTAAPTQSAPSDADETAAARAGGVVVYQTNNYAQAHSRYELYKTKQQTAAAVRLALAGV